MKQIKNKMKNNIKSEYKEINPKISNNILYNSFSIYSETTNLKKQQNNKLIKQKKINNNLRVFYFLFIILLVFLSRTIYLRIYTFIVIKNDDKIFKPDNKTIYNEEKFDSYIEAFNKSKDFININLRGKLINSTILFFPKKPKISIVIPCHNCKKYILRCIRSIQNQNFSDFEIIIVDDASDNHTLLYLTKLQEEDKRIKIISNKMNMGVFYSRSVGAFSSKGRYIFIVDSDDMYLDEYVLSTITNIAYKGNFDIIIFDSITTDLKPDVNTTKIHIRYGQKYHKPNLVLFQPNLGYYPISPSDNIEKPSINEIYLHPKCIKTTVYQKALNKYGRQRYLRYMISGEDILGNYILFNTAEVAKFVPRYGYIYMNNEKSSSKTERDKVFHEIYSIYTFDAMIDFSLNLSSNKKVLVNFILSILNSKYLRDALNTNDYNNNLFISCLDRFFNCSLISDENKNYVSEKGKYLSFINYNFSFFNNSKSEDDLI